MVDTFLPKLSQSLLEILEDDEYYDITIEVGNDPHVNIFRAHMNILYYRSPYFRRVLSNNKKKTEKTLTHVKLPNFSPEIFQIILSRVKNEQRATFNCYKCGPAFGYSDLIISPFYGNECIMNDYEKSIRESKYFDVELCEIFLINKK
ncbi:9159_t:CDS:2 [Funneliformis geosporum]|nr:9159_t:CDS:2 [Funneliformis geosporum]